MRIDGGGVSFSSSAAARRGVNLQFRQYLMSRHRWSHKRAMALLLMQKTQQFIKSVKGVTVTRLKQQIFFYKRAQSNDCRYDGAPLQGNLPYTL